MTRHSTTADRAAQSLLTRKRFQFAGALVIGALLPWLARGPLLPGELFEAASLNALFANSLAIIIAFWTAAVDRDLSGHPPELCHPALGADRTRHRSSSGSCSPASPTTASALAAGFISTSSGSTLLYVYAERNVRRRIAIVPFGEIAADAISTASTGSR